MNSTDLRARLKRLEKLTEGLEKEATLWKNCNAPVLYVHRLEYIESIQEAVSRLDKARVALAKMIREEEIRPRLSQ